MKTKDYHHIILHSLFNLRHSVQTFNEAQNYESEIKRGFPTVRYERRPSRYLSFRDMLPCLIRSASATASTPSSQTNGATSGSPNVTLSSTAKRAAGG